MSAMRLAEIILKRCNDKIEEHHRNMDKGQSQEIYWKTVGRNAELREVISMTRETLARIEGEDVDDL